MQGQAGLDPAGAAQHLCVTLFVAITSLLWGWCDKPPAPFTPDLPAGLQALFAQWDYCGGLLSFELSAVDLLTAVPCAGIDVQWPNQRF